MAKKSSAATNLCVWVIAVVKYNGIWRKVKPLEDAAKEAKATADEKGEELAVVMEKLEKVRAKVAALNE